jgi:hypothetical protein
MQRAQHFFKCLFLLPVCHCIIANSRQYLRKTVRDVIKDTDRQDSQIMWDRWNFPTWRRPSVTTKKLLMNCSLLVWVVFRGARIRYGTEVSRFLKCLPLSTGEIHHYDTEVRMNNFGEVLASDDKILWRGNRRWSAIFCWGRTRPES